MAVLASRLLDRELQERQQKEASMRKSLVGSGDRSERIRTYNFPQGRVTDHRINLTLHKIDAIMDGDLDELTTALAQEHQAEQLAALGDERMKATCGSEARVALRGRRHGSRRCASNCANSSPADYDDLCAPRPRPASDALHRQRQAVDRDEGIARRARAHPRLSALYPDLGYLAHVAPRYRRVHRLVLAQVRGKVARHRDRLLAAAERLGPAASRPKARRRWRTTASTTSVFTGSSASRIAATRPRSTC